MILDLDAGNTRLKWRLLREPGEPGPEVVGWGATGSACPDLSAVSGLPVARVRLSSVLAEVSEAALLDTIRAVTHCEPQCARTRAAERGLTNAYADPSRLGVDRWLAMLGARNAVTGAVCVVDVGTTMTLDAIDDDGSHLGGYIVPGIEMMAGAVYGDTGRVRKVDDSGSPQAGFGRSTEAAVGNGVLAMLLALIERGVGLLAERAGRRPATLITGGGAVHLLEHLPTDVQYRRDLVLEGLAVQIP